MSMGSHSKLLKIMIHDHEEESQPDITKASEDGLRLQKYSRDITYRPGPNIPVKHALPSVNLFNESLDEDRQSDMEVLLHTRVKSFPLSHRCK